MRTFKFLFITLRIEYIELRMLMGSIYEGGTNVKSFFCFGDTPVYARMRYQTVSETECEQQKKTLSY